MLILAVAGIITTVTVTSGNKTQQVSKQLSLGEKYLSELEYDKAVIAFNKVIEIEPRNLGAYLGLAEAYEGLGQTEDALRALEVAVTVIRGANEDTNEILENSEEIYIRLAELYEENGEREKAFETLLKGYEMTLSQRIASFLKEFYAEIKVYPKPGTYAKKQRISLISSGGTIYYTLDGSEPTKESSVYLEPIEINEGSTTIKAIYENVFGEMGEVMLYSYLIVDSSATMPTETPQPTETLTPTPTSTPTPILTPISTPTPSTEPTPKSIQPKTDKESVRNDKNYDIQVIHWKDSAFEAIVREALGKPSGDIHVEEIDNFGDWLVLYRDDIKTIEDFKWFKNVRKLWVRADLIQNASNINPNTNVCIYFNGLTKISDILSSCNIEEINKIDKLEMEISKYNYISYGFGHAIAILPFTNNLKDFSDIDILINFPNLTALELSNHEISDISYLSSLCKLKKLRHINLDGNKISDFSVLANIPSLESISLNNNAITEFSTLTSMKNLTWILFNNNKISDISCIEVLSNLEGISLDSNNLTDISVVGNLKELSCLYVSNNNISDISCLGELDLNYLTLYRNRIKDISSLRNMENLFFLDLHDNEIKDISPLKKLRKLTSLILYDNPIEDWSPVSHLEYVSERP